MLAPSFFAAVVTQVLLVGHRQRADSDAGFTLASFVRRHRSKGILFPLFTATCRTLLYCGALAVGYSAVLRA